jgi:hypothetical protein
MQRAKAFETDDYALRCYIDQLPVDRCLFCATPTAARQLKVAGPLHRWTSLHEMADTGGVLDKLVVASALLGGVHNVAAKAKSQQTKGTVAMAVCWKCAPSPKVPALVAAALVVATCILGALALVWPAVIAGGAALVAFGIAFKRMKLSVGEIDEDDFMFKLHGVDDGVKTEVIALGSAPHPRSTATASQLRA